MKILAQYLFISGNIFYFIGGIAAVAARSKSDAVVGQAKTRYCFGAVKSGGCCVLYYLVALYEPNICKQKTQTKLLPRFYFLQFLDIFSRITISSGRLGVQKVQILSASAEKLEQ